MDALLGPEKLLDLTQPLGPATILWPGSRPFAAEIEVDHDTHGGYARNLSMPEHSGTHLDAPAHFARDGATVEEIAIGALVRPAVCLDVRELVGEDASFTLSAATIAAFEDRDGVIPTGTAVLVCTGWDRYHGDADRFRGPGDSLAFPGIAADAARLLVERRVAGIGIDTLSVDAGHATTFPTHHITLPAGLWHLEGLTRLERVPPRGAWLVAAAIPVVEASGAPARAFAILP
ncbi:MAG: cyclase family protein [Gaiellaceae bacterium]